MKKVIKGAVYNTMTAKKICEQRATEASHEKGAYLNQLKQLYKTKSGKYFFYIENEFSTYIDVSNDDLNPKYELQDVMEQKIIPISYEAAIRFASEVIVSDPNEKETIGTFFPRLIDDSNEGDKKIQKKIYLSEKASWYLEMMLLESEETNSSFIENLISEQYRKLYKQGIIQNDPYDEMNEN
ncbi:hypothetical protein [Exiguobacterium aurantiacum]|uniref:Uncharacterized protein n=1 Tax=Exiguobacterium aurantiacum TaxID=33987 RepID=A0ABY5FPG5_9BACL|nr:hypothetical protein [Exiguobacterium aurantiacum]UTT43497.1 hypothetical protein NMQ00_03070 [Exiguobacterium aurantiacum]